MSAPSTEQLRASFRGDLIQPADTAYDSARRVYNGMIDKSPYLIARCVDVADVIAAVRFGADKGMLTAIRGGGHNGAGLGTCEGGLVIDLSRMKGIRVNPADKTVRVEAGCVWGDVDHATHAFGMATPSGFISTTGVAGLTLGGGIGHLSRRYGLTIDNLLSVDVVLADGRFVIANNQENPDLFWAVRGGGGNFGVVTSFEFRLHPVNTVQFGPTFWPFEEATSVLRAYCDFIKKAPEHVSGFFAFLIVPPAPMFPAHLHLKKVCGIFWCCTGTPAETEESTKAMRSVGHPLFDQVGPAPFPTAQSLFDGFYVSGLQWYWRADNFSELSDEAITRHVEHGSKIPTMHSTMHLYPVNGAPQRVGKTDTAYSFREALFAEVIVGVDPDPANNQKITDWCKNYWEALHPFSAGGAYVNFMMEEGQDRVQATYRDNYQRLAAIKRVIIEARREHYTGKDGVMRQYTSARLTTRGTFSQAYGRFTARIKLPRGQGMWPAFWLLGDDFDKLSWPGCGEIDIMENIGKEPASVHGSMHGPGYSRALDFTSTYKLPGGPKFSDDFHVFSIEWEPNVVRFYADEYLYSTFVPAQLPSGKKWVFDHPFYIILNLAVGGDWPGPPDSTTKFPQQMLVDYVRVYNPGRNPLPSR